jgi:predicted nucleotidyltransferase
MQRIVTLTERKTTEAVRRAAAVETLVPVLAAYARTHGGRFLLFGSAARGQMKFTSDVDLLLDFPDAAFGAAWDFAEAACWDRGLEPDLLPYGGCKPAFLDHIAPDLRVLG